MELMFFSALKFLYISILIHSHPEYRQMQLMELMELMELMILD